MVSVALCCQLCGRRCRCEAAAATAGDREHDCLSLAELARNLQHGDLRHVCERLNDAAALRAEVAVARAVVVNDNFADRLCCHALEHSCQAQ